MADNHGNCLVCMTSSLCFCLRSTCSAQVCRIHTRWLFSYSCMVQVPGYEKQLQTDKSIKRTNMGILKKSD